MDWQDTDLVIKRSDDGGATWSAILNAVPGGYDFHNVAGNIGIVQDSTTGRIWMPFTRGNWEFYMTYSDDDGVTWIDPYVMEGMKYSWRESWVGFGPPAGMESSSGRLVIPGYSSNMPIYDNGIFTYSFIMYSDDHGVSWSRSDALPTDGWAVFSGMFGNEAQIVEFKETDAEPATLLINSRGAWGPRIQSYSTDDGDSWSEYEDTTLPQPVLGCEGTLVALDDDRVLFAGPDAFGILRVDMTVWESADRGKTWDYAYQADTETSATIGYVGASEHTALPAFLRVHLLTLSGTRRWSSTTTALWASCGVERRRSRRSSCPISSPSGRSPTRFGETPWTRLPTTRGRGRRTVWTGVSTLPPGSRARLLSGSSTY